MLIKPNWWGNTYYFFSCSFDIKNCFESSITTRIGILKVKQYPTLNVVCSQQKKNDILTLVFSFHTCPEPFQPSVAPELNLNQQFYCRCWWKKHIWLLSCGCLWTLFPHTEWLKSFSSLGILVCHSVVTEYEIFFLQHAQLKGLSPKLNLTWQAKSCITNWATKRFLFAWIFECRVRLEWTIFFFFFFTKRSNLPISS